MPACGVSVHTRVSHSRTLLMLPGSDCSIFVGRDRNLGTLQAGARLGFKKPG